MTDARGKRNRSARDEYRRALYAAMTRAREWLVIAGTQGRNKIADGCWYQLVEDALKGDCVTEKADDGAGDVLRYRKRTSPPERIERTPSSAAITPTSAPSWLRSNASSEISGVRTVTPSSAEDDDARAPASGGRTAALLRGSLTHRLLQSLPDIPEERRRQMTADYLAREGKELDQEQAKKIAEEVLVLLADEAFSDLFEPGSRAEVPIVGRLLLDGKKPCAFPARSIASPSRNRLF